MRAFAIRIEHHPKGFVFDKCALAYSLTYLDSNQASSSGPTMDAFCVAAVDVSEKRGEGGHGKTEHTSNAHDAQNAPIDGDVQGFTGASVPVDDARDPRDPLTVHIAAGVHLERAATATTSANSTLVAMVECTRVPSPVPVHVPLPSDVDHHLSNQFAPIQTSQTNSEAHSTLIPTST